MLNRRSAITAVATLPRSIRSVRRLTTPTAKKTPSSNIVEKVKGILQCRGSLAIYISVGLPAVMTVGVVSIAGYGTDSPKVILGADRLLTTHQMSAIEHEHTESKISKIGPQLPAANIQCVAAGALSLAEELRNRINSRIVRESQQKQAQGIGVQHVAKWSAQEYRGLVQDKVENVVLSSYGLEMDDLSRQHQFKDGFFQGVVSEAEQLEQKIHDNPHILLGGVDTTGAYVYGISSNDKTNFNDPGYATIGSGTQPAQSEFIKHEYGKSCAPSEALCVFGAALYEAKEASGVGGNVDIGIVGKNSNTELDDDMVGDLMEREETIADEQEAIREDRIEDSPIGQVFDP